MNKEDEMLINYIKKTCMNARSLFVVLVLMTGAIAVNAQATKATPDPAPSPTPTPMPDVIFDGYRVSGSSEIGFRWRSVSGNSDTYNSNLNYGQGFRTFDGSILLESVKGKGKY